MQCMLFKPLEPPTKWVTVDENIELMTLCTLI